MSAGTDNPEPLAVLREMLREVASALHIARQALDEGVDSINTASLVCNELGRIGWMVERALQAAGEEKPLLVGSAEGWMLADRVQEGLRALEA